MNKHEDSYDEAWFARLDALVTGEVTPTEEDDDLLRMAAKLSAALAPLQQSLPPRDIHTPPPQDTREGYPGAGRHGHFGGGGKVWLRNILAVVAACFVLFGVVSACPSSSQVAAATLNASNNLWQAATSFAQIDASSVALLAVKQAGVRPLLPQALPTGTQALEFGIITAENNPRNFIAFVADYRIVEEDVTVYERSGNLVLPSSAAQGMFIGTSKGQLFQDDAGNRILQWYQDGITCSIASTLPVNELLAIARQFEPITNWDLLL